MKTITKKVNRYPGHDKSLLHLTALPWFNERYLSVLKEGNPKRIAKYKNMDPMEFVIEQPLAVFREEGYFHASIVARRNGLLFPDPKLKFATFEDFLSKIDPDKKIYQNENLPLAIGKSNLELIAKNVTEFPSTPVYFITKIEDSDNYALLVFSDDLILNLSEIYETVFNGYDFQEINGTALSDGDTGYPQSSQETLTGYVTGSIDVKELLLKEQEVKIDIFNIKLIKDLIEVHRFYYNGDYIHNGKITYSGPKG